MDDKLTEALRLLGHCRGLVASLPAPVPTPDVSAVMTGVEYAQWVDAEQANRDNLVARIDKLTEEATSDG